ncbi:pentapeptide repeat-containing protein [Chromohalobacter sp. 48-RD10]|uniref:pentapeptide repeat-containing protein n=1 Tax=Chromohalobacter sp. 48-RD10 TaxID=2994063 RepID=UPI002468D7AC|nr:pentapeptide repeat-containing protein [Chromohalobacter sp. 48-RD10]
MFYEKLPGLSEKVTESLDLMDVEKEAVVKLKKIEFSEPGNNPRRHTKDAKFIECLFSHANIVERNFSGCKFENCIFNGAEIFRCEFHQCSFKNCVLYKTRISDTYLDPKSFYFSASWYRHWANVNAWWFQSLHRNSMDIHQKDFAMHADRRFRFYRRYEELLGKKKRPLKFLLGLGYDLVLGYGYGITNCLVVTIGLILLFAYLMAGYTNLPVGAGGIEHIYYSIVSFTTVGYGEVIPEQKHPVALVMTSVFLFLSVVWTAIVSAVVVKRVVN